MRRQVVAAMIASTLLVLAAVATANEGPGTAGTFSPTGSLNEAGGHNSAALLPDGRVFVLGGGFERASAAEVWDPALDAFGPAPRLTWGRTLASATSLPDGRVLVVGGQPDSIGAAYPRSWDVLRVAETWDPATPRFSPAGILSQSRANHAALLMPDGQVLVMGGGIAESSENTAELWDPATGIFESVAWLAASRMGPTETLLSDGRVLVVGGGSPYGFGPFPVAQVWDPDTSSFSSSGSLIETRTNHSATLLPDGRVLVVGGYGEDGPLASAELWEPATGAFSRSGSLAEARSLHTATLLPDGRVLVVGGWHDEMGDYTELATAEIWDPATNEFSPAGSLHDPRDNHTATLLPDGRVLVVGGDGVDGPLSSAELWTPTSESPAS